MIHGLFLGNDYPGTSYSLPDCVLDAERMFGALRPYLAPRSVLLRNDDCTLANVVRWIQATRPLLTSGDAVLGYNSGHGTSQRVGGQQLEGLVLARGVVWWEQNLRELLAPLSPAIFISDSCFSGGLARSARRAPRASFQPRFVPPSMLSIRRFPASDRLPRREYDYFAACAAGETADSTGDGGAFTNAALAVLRASHSRLTMQGLFGRVRKVLPSAEHPQTPQFFASDRGFATRTLASFAK